MYSVEDLLISHGYKLPQHPSSSTSSTPGPAQARPAPSPVPGSYGKHAQGPLGGAGPQCAVNGYEREAAAAGRGDAHQQQQHGGRVACPNNNNNTVEAPRDTGPQRPDGEALESRSESVTSDSGFCEVPKGAPAGSKDLSYWRRRGQDFTVLMDYADFREHHGGAAVGYRRAETPQQPRGQEAGGGAGGEERHRAAQERQRWAAQAQARAREREAALHRWRLANERKCQSLGTDEWRPAVGFGRQLSESEAERWAHEQQRLHARTPDGLGVHPRTKVKSQSLPRMLPPDGPRSVDVAAAGLEPHHRRPNGHPPPSPHDFYRAAPRWPENGRPASANQLSMTPKARFMRPPRPPSYEVHQQIRGSCEVLSGRDSVLSLGRDRTPLPLSRAGDPQLDYFAQDSGPPGYIAPPSYKRAPIFRGVRGAYGEIIVDYRYRGDMYQQVQVAPDGSHWFSRHPAGSWPDPPRERGGAPVQRQLYPVYASQQHPGVGVQYIPFDDPRVRHLSSALGGNSLTDADKIRHIRNELPGAAAASEAGPDDSAFLPPPLGPFVAAAKPKPSAAHPTVAAHKLDNDNDRWHSDLHKETVDNFPAATDQNCNVRYPKGQLPPPSPSSVFQVSALTACASRQGPGPGHAFTQETITQVKKIVPDSGPDANRNSRRRVSETIFCLVSVPIHTPAGAQFKDRAADQNNNETIPRLTITNTDSVTVRHSENQNARSQSVNAMPIRSRPPSHYHTSSTSSLRNYKRAPLRKEIIDAWALQANEDKERCYAGSWPGNQYRNQETQTTSPPAETKSPDPQSSPSDRRPPCGGPSDAAVDGGPGADGGDGYGYPMAGQKDLQPSSNSAFSRLSLTLAPPPSPPPSQPAPCSPVDSHLAPCSPADSHPAPCSQPRSHPAPCSQPRSHPAPCSPADSHPAPCSPADSHPAPCSPADSRPAPCSQPRSHPAPCFQPAFSFAPVFRTPSRPSPCSPPASHPAPCSPPRSQHAPCSPPRSQHAPCSPPASHHAPCSPPRSRHAPCSPPRSHHAPCSPPASHHAPRSPPHSHPVPCSPPASHPVPCSPPPSPQKNGCPPPGAAEQVAFGQFLLKPVDRRPWDAIGELECINKELEITISKRPNAEPGSGSPDDAHHQATRHKAHPPRNPRTAESQLQTSHSGQESTSLLPTQGSKPNSARVRSEPCSPTINRGFREARSAFTRTQSARDHHAHPHHPPPAIHADPHRDYRQDIPVPQESLLKDVGLTVYTETPGAPGEPVLRSLTSPSHHPPQDPGQPPQENRPPPVQHSAVSQHNSSGERRPDGVTARKAKDNSPQPRAERNIRMYRAHSENGRPLRGQGQGSPARTPRLERRAVRSFEEDVLDEAFVAAEPMMYKNESTVTDRHLESLLLREKANAPPSVDLSKLYEVKSAQGIPENESMEQRAARILGISVPVEAFGATEEREGGVEDPPRNAPAKAIAAETEGPSAGGETQQVVGRCEEVRGPSLSARDAGSDAEPAPERGSAEKDRGVPGLPEQMPALDAVFGNALGFPPSKRPPASAAVEKPAVCGAEKRNRGAASKLIESLQDKLSSSASLWSAPSGRSAAERMARLKERDSVSRIRRLSLKGSDSGGETEPEGRDGEPGEDGRKAEVRRGSAERPQEEAQGRRRRREEEEEEEGPPRLAELEHETHRSNMDPKEVEKVKVSNDEEQREEQAEEKRNVDRDERRQEELRIRVEENAGEGAAEIELEFNVEEEMEIELQFDVDEPTPEERADTELRINVEEDRQGETADVELQIDVEEEESRGQDAEVELLIDLEEQTSGRHAEVELRIDVEEEPRGGGTAEAQLRTEAEERTQGERAALELRLDGDALENRIALRAEEEEEEEEVEVTRDAVGTQNARVAKARRAADKVGSTADGARREAGARGGGEASPATQGMMRPKPRQRTGRPQKPPLLPKPRSVPKREVTLPLGLSTVTSDLEEQGVLSVSDSYDPSRVERV